MKRWLSLITGVAFFLVMSGTAMAVVDMNAAANPVNFANEIDVDTSGGTTLTSGGLLEATVELGFGMSAEAQRYARFDLSQDAQFDAAPNLTSAANITSSVADGGAGESYVIFQVTANEAVAASNSLTLGGSNVVAFNKSNVTISYAQYETAGDAVAQTSALENVSASYISWVQAMKVSAGTTTSDLIDVTQGSTYFDGSTGDDDTDIGLIEVGAANQTAAGGNIYWTDGALLASGDLLAANSVLTVSGDFSAAAANGVTLSIGGGTDPETLNGSEATFLVPAANLTTAGNFTINYQVTGTDPIAQGPITASISYDTEANAVISDQDLGTLTVLEKNGDSKVVLNIPRPDGMDAAFIRITNASAADGTVFGRLYAQDGTELWSGTLNDNLAGHATMVISPSDWESLTGLSTWSGRSRLVVEGEVPNLEVLGLIRTGGVLTNMSPSAPASNE